MSGGDVDLSPGSRLPLDARERDLLLRRVPEVAFLPELAEVRFGLEKVSRHRDGHPAAVIAELANAAYLERLQGALGLLIHRADQEANGGLRFVAESLLHFVMSLPAERHPLVVALYFLSLAQGDSAALHPEAVARRMDEYESSLEPLVP